MLGGLSAKESSRSGRYYLRNYINPAIEDDAIGYCPHL